MPRPDQRLYAALLRMGRRFRQERLPLMGVAGTDLVCYDLDWPATLRRQLEAPRPGAGLAEGAALLARLQRQLETLMQSEEHTREALAEWAALGDRFAAWRQHSADAPAARLPLAAAALEEGLQLVTHQAQELADPLQLELGMLGGEQSSGEGEPAALSLDELAAAVRQQHPGLFPGDGSSSISSSSSNSGFQSSSIGGSTNADSRSWEVQRQQVAALADVVYRQQRFKHEPFEWVYEGLQPLLLPPQLQRRKLAPLTLAAVAAGVARRLGLPLVPLPAEPGEAIAASVVEGPAGGAATGQGLPLEQLRPDVAQRYAGRAQGAAPAAGPWVLLLSGGSSSSATHAPRHEQHQQLMDACTGQVLGVEEARQKFPSLQLAATWQLSSPLLAWQHMVRTIIQAHQRRGESDLVAHWVYVLLALDPQAVEWEHMLHSSDGLAGRAA